MSSPSGIRRAGMPLLVAAPLVAVAYRNASYGPIPRAEAGALVCWFLICLSFARPRSLRFPAAAWIVAAGLVGLAAWSAVSISWAPSRDSAFAATELAVLYAAFYLLALVLVRLVRRHALLDGLVIAGYAIACVSLASRFFPGTFHGGTLQGALLPSSLSRLAFPIGYWNGLAYFVATIVPLALRLAVSSGTRAILRAAAVGYLPIACAVFFLSSSRGATVAALIGCVVFVVASRELWGQALTAVTVGAAGGLVVDVWLAHESALTNAPLTAAARSQGWPSALVVLGLAAAAAALYALAWRLGIGELRPGRAAAGVVAGAAVVAVVAASLVFDIRARVDAFKRSPASAGLSAAAESHYLSGNGTGRWQVWASAYDEFRTEPISGRGAGSFASWWAQHGRLPIFVRNAHSVYLETLGELGLIGFGWLLLAVGGGLVAGAVQIARAGPSRVADNAGALAAFAVFAASAAIDWTWQLPANGLVALLALATITAGLPGPDGARPLPGPQDRRQGRRRFQPILALLAALGAAGLLVQLYGLAIELRLRDSREAAAAGREGAALADARAAGALAPWLTAPRLQLALVEERFGFDGPAELEIERAVAQSRRDWQVWTIAARIHAENGHFGAAEASLLQARRLNPRSPALRP